MKAHLLGFTAAVGMAAAAMAAPSSGYHLVGRVGGGDGGWDYVSADPANHRVLVGRGNGVLVLDLATMSTHTLAGPGIHAAISIDRGKEILTTEGAPGAAHILDGVTGANLATIPTGRGADAALVEPKTGLAAVMNHSAGTVSLIDIAARRNVATIEVGGTLEAAVADGAGKIFVNIEDKGEVVAIDVAHRKVLAHYPMAGCEGPTGIDYDGRDKLLLVACQGTMAVLRADTGALVKTIPIGAGADGLAYDPARSLAFVPAGRDGTLSVLSTAGGNVTLIDTVATSRGARTIGLDRTSGRLYLPTGQYVPAANGRFSVAPGTFEVLVVGK